jgi:hypothetical protein
MVSGSYKEKLKELGLPTLEEKRHQADMLQTFKILRGIGRVDHWTITHGFNLLQRPAEPLGVQATP